MVKVKNDLTGQKFGHLTVIGRAADVITSRGDKEPRWLCRCDCGAEVIKKTPSLVHAKNPDKIACSPTCVCFGGLEGQKFGRLTVIERAPNVPDKNGRYITKWRCLCECGNYIDVATGNLKRGNTKSCGCYNRDMIVERNRKSRQCVGVFDGERGESRKNSHIYALWRGCFERCYMEASLEKHPTYRGCEVSEKWHRYSDFKKWYEENNWYDGPERVCVDKDILVKGNKIYGPDTCALVPLSLNVMFIKNDSKRGDLPLGVFYAEDRHLKYEALLRRYSKQYSLGTYATPEEAFAVYKVEKEKYIKEVADKYKAEYPNFPQKLYDAMYNYTVEITD